MNKWHSLLLLLAALLPLQLFAQYTEPDCGWYGNKTVEERNALFPFNKAKKVVLVAYPCITNLCLYNGTIDSAMAEFNAIKRLDFELGDFKRTYLIKEETVLNSGWVNQLSHVLVNYTLEKRPDTFIISSTCYTPRNAILFYDEAGSIICCYEICFQCGGTVMMPDPDALNKYADAEDCIFERLNEIKTIFTKNGISYGLEER